MFRSFAHALPGLLFALAAFGCGSSTPAGGTTPAAVAVAPVTSESFAEERRRFLGMAATDPARLPLRSALVTHLGDKTAAIAASDDYEGMVEHFLRFTDLLLPGDFDAGATLPSEMEAPARFLVERGSPRGDEARVMAGLLTLSRLTEGGTAIAEYEEVAGWGRDARSQIANPLERFIRLLRVWEEHARLTPSREVLAQLAGMHRDFRDTLAQAFNPERGSLQMMMRQRMQLAQRVRQAPLLVASVYLARGEIEAAERTVAELGGGSDLEAQLIGVLRRAMQPTDDGAEALLEIAMGFAEEIPDVAKGVCRRGLRRYATDPRFPQCLANVAVVQRRAGDAAGWYGRAIALRPEEQRLYDDALSGLRPIIEQQLFGDDPASLRELTHEVKRIQEEQQRRWPGTAPTIPPEQLHYLEGLVEMSAGNAAGASEHFGASLAIRSTRPVVLRHAELLDRTGHPDEAAAAYRKALELTPGDGPAERAERASLLTQLGSVWRHAGDDQRGNARYTSALEILNVLADELSGPGLGLIQARRGQVLDRLGRADQANAAFEEALMLASDRRAIYFEILTHLVATGSRHEMANEVFLRANRHVELEPEWKVYLGLWADAVAVRQGQPQNGEVAQVVRQQIPSGGWGAQLAGFMTGSVTYESLLESATNTGQRVEARFYNALALQRAGQAEAARAELQQVLDAGMFHFFEHQLAQELLLSTVSTAAPAPAATAPVAAPASP